MFVLCIYQPIRSIISSFQLGECWKSCRSGGQGKPLFTNANTNNKQNKGRQQKTKQKLWKIQQHSTQITITCNCLIFYISCHGFRHQLCYVRFPWIMQGLNPCVCFVNELIIISDDWGSIQNDNGLVTNCKRIHTFIPFVKKFATFAMCMFNILFLMALDLIQREKTWCKILKWFENSSLILLKG